MDWLRVRALNKALERERDSDYRKAIRLSMEGRLNILIEGSLKREKKNQADFFKGVLKDVKKGSTPVIGEGNAASSFSIN